MFGLTVAKSFRSTVLVNAAAPEWGALFHGPVFKSFSRVWGVWYGNDEVIRIHSQRIYPNVSVHFLNDDNKCLKEWIGHYMQDLQS